MRFTTSTVAAFCLSVGSVSAFTAPAFVQTSLALTTTGSSASVATAGSHATGCTCAACTGIHTPGCTCASCLMAHSASCACSTCRGSSTRLFASRNGHSSICGCAACSGIKSNSHPAMCGCAACTSTGFGSHSSSCACAACSGSRSHSLSCACAACSGRGSTRLFMSDAEGAEDVVPPEVEAMDGIGSAEEAHNAERPARSSLKKKTPEKGKELSEFSIGDTVSAKVKTITSYGAFLDIGATTDGLLHISNLSAGFVSDVKEFLKEGQEVEVRIMNIDAKKNQVGLTMMTAEEEEASKQPRQSRGGQRGGGGGGGGGGQRKDDSAVVSALASKGYDPSQFIEGTVASTVDFGAFIRFDASQLNSEVEGEMDGLCHISALSAGRADSVTSIVNVGDKVQVRCKSIDGRKVSLSMISVEQEEADADRRQSFGAEPVKEGAKDWKESLDKMRADLPSFANEPMVVDMRK